MGIQLNKRGFAVTMIPYLPLFTWYYIFSYNILKFIVSEYTKTFFICKSLFNFFIIFGLMLGNSFVLKIKEESIILRGSVISIIGTILIISAPISLFQLVVYLILAIILGISLISYFTIFWKLTVPEERGRVAGLMGFISIFIFSLIMILMNNLDFFGTVVLCIFLNFVTLVINLKPLKIGILTTKIGQRGSNPENRTILLYLIPWLIYSLINTTFAKTVSFQVSQYFSPSSLMWLRTLQLIGTSFGTVIGGIIADLFGRRYSVSFGLTLYGISSAISGLSLNYNLFLLSFIGTGLTWGIFMTLYLFIIWGDLANKETCGRRYSIGLIIFYLAEGVGTLFSPQLFQIPLIYATTINCFMIFLSNIPLILAPELLSSAILEKYRLILYLILIRLKKLNITNQG